VLEEKVKERTKEIAKQKEAIEEANEELRAKQTQILAQKDEIQKQRDLAEEQRDQISKQKQEITDSIIYAERIQSAVLPPREYCKSILPEHFILFKPRDIVSGDFYWMTEKNDKIIVVAADCTGHGVPAAFMSMLGVSFFNEIVNTMSNLQANRILNRMRNYVKKTLYQRGEDDEAKDGMDLALCIIDKKKKKLQYAGAYNSLYYIRDGELHQIKADRMPIGVHVVEKDSFTNHQIDLEPDDIFYIFSDGYVDQFGGKLGSKFKSKPFKRLLMKIHEEPIEEQKEILESELDDWKGDYSQVDDIIVIGFKPEL
jgi:serine phosphatase RsbU (regulator of sigma subunit)